ncbi:MAG: 4-alpha-glucanotransferase [Erysipelotrichales bacterium]|nr:4-alpha-glucanotransferase [Erysipelotrichales bacterium]
MNYKRSAGILLHITSLPSKYGVGTLGEEAYNFVDWLKKAGMKIWQVLPLVPTNYGDSPYQSASSTALNYYLIDFDILRKKRLLKLSDYNNIQFNYIDYRVDYSLLFQNKVAVLKKAFSNFNVNNKNFQSFVQKGDFKDFAVFMTIKAMHYYQSWTSWNAEYQTYSKELEERIINEHSSEYLFWQWTQYEFLDEWNKLHAYAKENDIEIMGDMPLYVAYDSVEVWKNPELFLLTESKGLKLVAGCPPDAFTEDGQLWGNPIYDWNYMRETNYEWWNQRIAKAFGLYDILRIDHFRGFDRYYAIPADHENARNGHWEDGPKFDLFKDKLGYKIVAEDLGLIDDGVRKLMADTQYPGMKVLEFAFDGNPYNEHKPSNCAENFVIYTGTHDNMPLYQYICDLNPDQYNTFIWDMRNECRKLNVCSNDGTPKDMVDTVVELAFASRANLCIIPMQDLLALGKFSRMNLPSTVSTDNWSYRISKDDLSEELLARLIAYTKKYNR